MGCIRSKPSEYQSRRNNRNFGLNPKKKSSIDLSQRPSQDIFALAHVMSSIKNDDVDSCFGGVGGKKLRTNTGGDSLQTSTNIFPVEHLVNRQSRGKTLDSGGKFRGSVVWLTGLSGAGKSTVAMGVEVELISRGTVFKIISNMFSK
jgi:hypothetical protein